MRQSASGCVFGEFGCIFAGKRTRILFLMTEVELIETILLVHEYETDLNSE